MKVAEYIKNGLKNFVDEKPEDYELLGSAKEGVHKVECYIKTDGNKIIDARYNSSKRCKKLLAIADVVCEKLKGQGLNNIQINDDEILSLFNEKKDKSKLKARLEIVKKAVFNK